MNKSRSLLIVSLIAIIFDYIALAHDIIFMAIIFAILSMTASISSMVIKWKGDKDDKD